MENSPFGRLAPELRNEIFSLAFTSESRNPIYLQHQGHHNALTRTCRQIRKDTYAVYYASVKEFHFSCFGILDKEDHVLIKFRNFLRLLGPEVVSLFPCLSLGPVYLHVPSGGALPARVRALHYVMIEGGLGVEKMQGGEETDRWRGEGKVEVWEGGEEAERRWPLVIREVLDVYRELGIDLRFRRRQDAGQDDEDEVSSGDCGALGQSKKFHARVSVERF